MRDGTQRARIDHLAHADQTGFVHVIMSRKANDIVRRGARHHRFDLVDAARHGLLYVDVLAVLHREQRQLAVRFHCGKHVDSIDVWVACQRLGARVQLDAVRTRALCGVRHNRAAASVPQSRQLRAPREPQRIRVQRRDVACSVESNTQRSPHVLAPPKVSSKQKKAFFFPSSVASRRPCGVGADG